MYERKIFQIYESISEVAEEISEVFGGLGWKKLKNIVHPREDYHLVSSRYPLYAVADGVTLEYDSEGNYPNPSGAGEVARIFCETIIREAERIYPLANETAIKSLFERANEEIGTYNRAQGRTKETSNFWDFDLFAATAAFAAFSKGGEVYWGSICDSFVAHFNTKGDLQFRSPECWPEVRRRFSPEWERIDVDERKRILRRVYRNGIDERGNLIGYGVLTGEETALRYLNFEKINVASGDLVVLFTDGFEEYMKLPEFIQLFSEWPSDLEAQVRAFTKEQSEKHPNLFGHERSLIAVKA